MRAVSVQVPPRWVPGPDLRLSAELRDPHPPLHHTKVRTWTVTARALNVNADIFAQRCASFSQRAARRREAHLVPPATAIGRTSLVLSDLIVLIVTWATLKRRDVLPMGPRGSSSRLARVLLVDGAYSCFVRLAWWGSNVAFAISQARYTLCMSKTQHLGL